METCIRDGCNRKRLARGLCHSHYQSEWMARIRAGVRSVARSCERCGADLAGRDPRQRFCSVVCKEAFYSEAARAATVVRLAGRTCVHCGKPITSSSGKAVTCSRECGVAHQNALRQQRARDRWVATKPPCRGCGGEIPETSRATSRFCSVPCKKAFFSARWRARAPGYMRQYNYGVTPEQYAAMLEAQDNRCAICRTDTPGGKGGWHLDHDHATKVVRGILCNHCNNGLGRFGDDPARLRAAAAYLERTIA